MSEILRIENLKTYFYTRAGIAKAVDGISFSVDRGEVFGLVGESGSGKSMTLRSILRLVPWPGRIVEGHIYYQGDDILAWPDGELIDLRGSEIATIFQEPMTALNPVMRVGNQIMEALQEHENLTGKALRGRAIELLRLVGIPAPERRLKEYPHQFSGGMRQRAMIAIALACTPKLLLADEPTTALDVTIQDQILRLVVDLQEQLHMSVIWVTHDLGVIGMICERVAVMYAGEIVEIGRVANVLTEPRHPYTLGLLESIPAPERRDNALVPIPGVPPAAQDYPSGCRFHPRCRFATEECKQAATPLVQIKPGHFSACIRVAEIWHD
jgi:peptide/nickel transport system ATP-binding protein